MIHKLKKVFDELREIDNDLDTNILSKELYHEIIESIDEIASKINCLEDDVKLKKISCDNQKEHMIEIVARLNLCVVGMLSNLEDVYKGITIIAQKLSQKINI